ncbi:DUF1868 domain-containing protein [Asaia bogorensis]|uniref:DUF1868 domain-containing protein n=1 Tax=Asaia bogorensis TaxID=91915 RepID=UPI0013CE94E8|nr:DUF1868 domain-containing protein [Asaia bogorensis]
MEAAEASQPEDDQPCSPGSATRGGERLGKFDETGKVSVWPGNTIICPFPVEHPLAQAMLAMNRMIASDYSTYMTTTPPSSYHMTILGGVDPEQRQKNRLPIGITAEMPPETVNERLTERLSRAVFDIPDPIEMQIDPDRYHAPITGTPLRPANAAIASGLYDLRRQIAEVLQFQPDDLTHYMFHATYAYRFRSIPFGVKWGLRKAVHQWRRNAADRLGSFTIPGPVFCSFETMFAFKPLLPLRSHGPRPHTSSQGHDINCEGECPG